MAEMHERFKGMDTGGEKARQFPTTGGHPGTSTGREENSGVVATAVEKAKDAAGAVADYAGQAQEKVQEWASTAKEYASDAYDRTGEALQYAGDETTNLIRRYPIPALLIGFGIGFLLGRGARNLT